MILDLAKDSPRIGIVFDMYLENIPKAPKKKSRRKNNRTCFNVDKARQSTAACRNRHFRGFRIEQKSPVNALYKMSFNKIH